MGLGNLRFRLLADDSQFTANMAKANKSARSLSSSMQETGMAAAKLGAAMGALQGVALKTFASFESRMIFVKELTGATAAEFAGLEAQAKKLGETTKFTASQSAEAMEFLAKAGNDVNTIMTAMPGVLDSAAAAGMDVGRAADLATNIMAGYGIQAEDLGKTLDVLTGTFTSSNTTMEMLAETFKFAGPVAKSAGIEFEELAAATGILGTSGYQGGMAGRILRRSLANLIDPSAKVEKILNRLNVEVKDSQGGVRDLADIMTDLEKSGATTADVMGLFGVRAGPGMIKLLDAGGQAIRDYTAKLKDTEGITKRLSEARVAGLAGAFTILKSKIEGVALDMGERLAPAAHKLVGLFSDLTVWVRNLSPETKALALKVSAVVTAIGGAGVAMVALGTAIPPVLTALSTFGVPLAILAGLIVIIGQFKIAWDKNMGGLKSKTQETFDFLKRIWDNLASGALEAMKEIDKATDGLFGGLKGLFSEKHIVHMPVELQGNQEAIELAQALLGQGMRGSTLTVQMRRIMGLGDIANPMAHTIPVSGLTAMDPDKAGKLIESFGIEDAGREIKNDTLAKNIVSSIQDMMNPSDISSNLSKAFSEGLGVLKDLLPEGMQQKLDAALGKLSDVLNSIGKAGEKASDPLKDFPDGIRFVSESAETATASLRDLAREFKDVLSDGFRSAVKAAAPILKGALTGTLGNVIGGAKSGFEATGDPVGAIAGAIAALLTESETFQRILSIVNEHLSFVADLFGMLLEPLAPIIDLLGMLLKSFMVINPALMLLEMTLELLTPLFRALFDGLKFFGIVALKVARFLLKTIGKSTKKVDEQLRELQNTTFDTAGQVDVLGDAAEEAAAALYNIPDGIKLAAARFNSQDADSGSFDTGSSTDGDTDYTRGVIDAFQDAGYGGTPNVDNGGLGSNSSGLASSGSNINIEKLVFNGDASTETFKRFKEEMEREGVLVTGNPDNPNPFGTPRSF